VTHPGGGQVSQALHAGQDVQIAPAGLVSAAATTRPVGLSTTPWPPQSPSEEILMTRPQPAPSLPPPLQPAQAAQALAETARAAVGAWAQPLDPDGHSRAVSQLHSAVRDLGVATRGLAQWMPAERPPETALAQFARHVTAGARWLLSAWNCLDEVLAFQGAGTLPDPDEPGAALCHAARLTILAWRQPSGSCPDRDTATRHLITVTGLLSDATASLAARALGHRAIDLLAVGVCLAEATASLDAAIQEPGSEPAAGPEQAPARHPTGRPE
jgi:hypothetical protein